jgi:hypothetical protein
MLSKALQGAAKGVAVDSDFENVTLLLHGNGTNGAQNNTFTDGSSNAFSITRNGNTTQGTFSPYGDNWSNYFDGTGDYLNPPNDSANSFGTGDFTVEAWIYPTSTSSASIVSNRAVGGADTVLTCAFSTANGLFLHTQNTAVLNTGTNVTANTWQHVAFVRASGTLKIYLDGVSVGSASMTQNLSSTNALYIAKDGTKNDGGETGLFSGYISNTRIVKGTAVYTAAFTPPTAPLTAITNTSLLTCQSNRFIDNSTNAFTITRNGDVSVQRFSPFSPTAAYASGTISGSGYFDGTGDYLTVSNNAAFQLGTGDFTLECWYYPEDISLVALFGLWGPTSSNASYLMYLDTSGYPVWYTSTNGSTHTASLTSTVAVTLKAWNHIVITRLSGTTRIFVNGTSGGSTSTSVSLYAATSQLTIGYNPIGGTPDNVQGYLSDVRILKGTGYSSITVPTAPLTNITNTSLLTNFTNAGIIDNAMMNDLETVGNAQISTTQSKFGGSSMYFDETGDYLTTPSTQNVAFGTGNFTIECWVRFATSTVGNGQGVFQLSNGYLNSAVRGPAVGTDDTSGKWAIYYGTSSSIHATSIPSINTWYHVAFVRNSSTSKLYIDGTELISVSDSTNYTDTNFTIGGWYSSSYLLNGYIDDLRITKGVARYTANFTAPTAPFADQ